MTEKKYDNLLRVSLAVLAVSAIMLGVSTYNIYFSKKPASSSAETKQTPETLPKQYSDALARLDRDYLIARKNADTLSVDLSAKLAEFGRLRNELEQLLKTASAKPDFILATRKIDELQGKVASLTGIRTSVEAENDRLRNLLSQYSSGDVRRSSTGLQSVSTPREPERGGPVTASQLQLAMWANAGNRDKETNDAEEAEKISGSFSVKNLPPASRAELVVVVLQPDGKVVRSSAWEMGTFETKEGRKIYSRKIFYDPASDNRPLNFSLSPETFMKGEYTMQVWYNGTMLGKTAKQLG